MSTFEITIWYILGYISMPLIFLGGFAASAVLACFLLNRFNQQAE